MVDNIDPIDDLFCLKWMCPLITCNYLTMYTWMANLQNFTVFYVLKVHFKLTPSCGTLRALKFLFSPRVSVVNTFPVYITRLRSCLCLLFASNATRDESKPLVTAPNQVQLPFFQSLLLTKTLQRFTQPNKSPAYSSVLQLSTFQHESSTFKYHPSCFSSSSSLPPVS